MKAKDSIKNAIQTHDDKAFEDVLVLCINDWIASEETYSAPSRDGNEPPPLHKNGPKKPERQPNLEHKTVKEASVVTKKNGVPWCTYGGQKQVKWHEKRRRPCMEKYKT